MRGWMADNGFPNFAAWIGRAGYLLSMGRPTAQIAVYHPAMSMWLNEAGANQATLTVIKLLLEQQRDFDLWTTIPSPFLSPSIRACCAPPAAMSTRAVIVPEATAISRGSLDRLRAFAKSGGRVVFLGKRPSMVVDASFLKAVRPAI